MTQTATARGDQRADEVYRAYYLPLGLLPYPVDIFRLCDRVGLDCFAGELPAGHAGALMRKKGGVPEIIVNGSDPLKRQRFTAAHELGHYFLRVDSGELDEYEWVDRRDQLAFGGTDDDEIFCNSFAACLLMPKHYLQAEFSREQSTPVLAESFNVSIESMKWRLKNQGWV